MERTERCISLAEKALSELGQINFTGLSTIPAGRVTEALYIMLQELKKMELEAEDRDDNDREDADG